MLFEVANLPCWWDMRDEPLVVGYCIIWEWLVRRKWRLKARRGRTHQIDILAGYACFLAAAWTAPSSSTVQHAAEPCAYHLSLDHEFKSIRVGNRNQLTLPLLSTVLAVFFFPIVLTIVVVVVGIIQGHKKIIFLSSYLVLSDRCMRCTGTTELQGPLKSQNSSRVER